MMAVKVLPAPVVICTNALICHFVSKADGVISLNPFEFAAGIACGLILHRGDLLSDLCPFCPHNTYRSPINKEHIVHLACTISSCGWDYKNFFSL
mgnify:CR=1 FL=1